MPLMRTLLLTGAYSLAFAISADAQTAMPMDHANMDHMAHMGSDPVPTESGQSAFGAIHEIVDMLEADPKTDWWKVDIDGLRQHLADMDNVTLRARITYTPTVDGENIHISGDGDVRDSIHRMVMMHIRMAGTTKDWTMTGKETPDGVDATVVANNQAALQKIRALGLIGMMSDGMHHQLHHWMLATRAMAGM